jgi:hypothetical protein
MIATITNAMISLNAFQSSAQSLACVPNIVIKGTSKLQTKTSNFYALMPNAVTLIDKSG